MKTLFRNIKFIIILPFFLIVIGKMAAATNPIILQVESKTITLDDGRTKSVYTIVQNDGAWGYYGVKGEEFNAIVKNTTNVPTVIHWHGLILPNSQDGVPDVTQKSILPGNTFHYNYKLQQSGTYWMHSHFGLQMQDLMEAPFIIT